MSYRITCHFVLGAALFFAGTPAHAAVELIHEAPDKNIQHYFLSMKGAFEHISGATRSAQTTYRQLELLDPKSKPLQHANVRLALEQGNYQGVIARKSTIDINNPHHLEASVNLAQAYLFSGQPQQSIKILATLEKKQPHDSRIAYYQALAHIKAQSFLKADAIIERSITNEHHQSRHFLFYFLKAKIHFLQNKLAQAKQYIDHCLKLHPHFTKGFLLKGIIAEKQADSTTALAIYEKYIAQTKDPEITKKVIALHFAAQNFVRARQLLQTQHLETADHYYDLAVVAYRLNDRNDAYKNVSRSLSKEPTHSQAQQLKANLLLSEHKFDALSCSYMKWLGKQPNNTALITRLYRSVDKGVPARVVIATLKAVASQYPTLPLCFALADLLHSQQHYDTARVWYDMALKSETCAPLSLQASKLHFQRAVTHYAQKEFGQAEAATERALKCTPAYPSAHNLAALLRAEQKKDLESARRHIDTALLAAPNNAAYLDTLAHVLIAQGHTQRATAILEKVRAINAGHTL